MRERDRESERERERELQKVEKIISKRNILKEIKVGCRIALLSTTMAMANGNTECIQKYMLPISIDYIRYYCTIVFIICILLCFFFFFFFSIRIIYNIGEKKITQKRSE